MGRFGGFAMNGWNGYSSGSGAEHEPSEDRGRSAWSSGETGSAPPWASAETQTSFAPPWATAGTQAAPLPPWTPVAQTPVGPPRAPRRVRRVLAALAVAVLVGVSVGAGVWLLLRGTALGSGDRTGAGPAPSVTGPSSPSPSGSTASGYRRVQDPVGYTLDVPGGWTRTEKQGQSAPVVIYDAPADGRRLQVFRITEDTPAQSLDLAENDRGYGFARQPGYRVVDRASGTTWAELVYRYDDTDLGARQVVDHRFQAADGTLYAIRATGPASLAPALVREPLTRALASFCPADTECA
ncbi:hypothetical protein [Streptomyces sp. SAI-149]|uniref:hypothetical protein n=2 Tax=Streptomyces TaxID=1883 RepID=UPI000FB0A182|nr:hypothetical protein [Streptomyces sp. SAI-149]MDH6452351.1 hypothetical protein [Streptomyces sp. SAI-119]MDH6497093.1 hypothetical protein [Streptomyces sp. SAI-149]